MHRSAGQMGANGYVAIHGIQMQFEAYPSLYMFFIFLFHPYITVLRQVGQVLLQTPIGLQLQSLRRFLDFGLSLLWPPASPFRLVRSNTVGLVLRNRLL